jgi:hypothetical protein
MLNTAPQRIHSLKVPNSESEHVTNRSTCTFHSGIWPTVINNFWTKCLIFSPLIVVAVRLCSHIQVNFHMSPTNRVYELYILLMPAVLYFSFTNIQKNCLGKDKIHTQATYRQDDIRCRNWIPLTFMPYSVLQITSVRLKLVAMVVLGHCKVWVYVVRQSLCCLNLHTSKHIQHILNISYSCNAVSELTNCSHNIHQHPYFMLFMPCLPRGSSH